MGINQCSRGNILWKATGLTLHSIKSFRLGNRIDIDGNLLFYQLQGSAAKTIEVLVGEMALLLKQIAHSGGFRVTIVIDGDARPDCKRASWERRKDLSLTKINRMYCRFKVLELSSRLEKESLDEVKRAEIKSELCLFNAAAKSLENKSGRVGIPNNFGELLLHRLKLNNAFKTNENGGYVSSSIIKATFQADYVIALRSIEGKNDFIYSSDSDFAALLGNDCVLIDKVTNQSGGLFKTKRKKKNENQVVFDSTSFLVTLAGVSNKKMAELRKCVGNQAGVTNGGSKKDTKMVWTSAKRPLFEDKPLRLRAMIALALGCDVFQGVKGCGPATVEKVLKSIEKEQGSDDLSMTKKIKIYLETQLKRKKKNDEKETFDDTSNGLVDTLLDAFLCEPGVIAKEIEVENGSNDDSKEDIDENGEDEQISDCSDEEYDCDLYNKKEEESNTQLPQDNQIR